MPKANKATFLLLWLFNPFISSVYLFKNFRYNTSIYPYLLLSFFFGLSFVVSTTGGDSGRYAEQLYSYHQRGTSLSDVLNSFYSEEDGKLDVYQPLVTWFLSLFTDNAKVLFASFALVFGYFWFKSLMIIRSQITVPLKQLTLLVFLWLVFTNPIWNINGVRMWTAIGIFFYGILLLHVENNRKGWIFLILPMFVHFSLVLPLGVYILYRIIPIKNVPILFSIYLGTFFLGEFDLNVVKNYLLLLPDFIQAKDGYLSEEYVEVVQESRETKSLFYTLAISLSKFTVFSLTCIIYFYLIVKNKLKDNFLSQFYFVALVFLSFSNIVSLMPSGGRFAVLSNLILLTTFLLFLNKKIKIPPFIKLIISASITFVLIFRFREAIETIGVFLFIGNPIVNWFVEDIPIIEFIKSIF